MKTKNIILWIGLAFFTSACSIYSIDTQELTDKIYSPKDSARQIAYLETVTDPYEIIGTITVTTERKKALNEVIEKMKTQAAVLGGDAITNIKTDSTGIWKKIPPHKLLANAYIRANFTATVIVFKKSQPSEKSQPSQE